MSKCLSYRTVSYKGVQLTLKHYSAFWHATWLGYNSTAYTINMRERLGLKGTCLNSMQDISPTKGTLKGDMKSQ